MDVDWGASTSATWYGFYSDTPTGPWTFDQTIYLGDDPVEGIGGEYYVICDGGESSPPSGNISNVFLCY